MIRLILISLSAIIFFSSCNSNNDKKVVKDIILKEEKPLVAEDTLYSIVMTGDVMMGTNYPSSYSLPPNDGKDILVGVKEYLEYADVTIGNLEGTLLNSGGTPKVCNDPNNCIAFRMPEHYAGYLKDAGFDIMSVANNHSGDMGEEGRKSTVNTLESYDIKYAGYTFCPTTIFVKDGIKFGFTSFAPNTGTQSLNDEDAAIKTVKELKKKCDIVIVSFHGGAEGSGAQRVSRRREFFLGEDRGNVYEFAHSMIDAGADIVFGQGPHVARALELYNNRIIAYSLGNFCTYGKFGLSGALGLAPMLRVFVDKEGKFVKGRIFPVKQIKRGVPVIDYDFKIVEILQKLTSQDFPETNLVIEDDGGIKIRE